MSENTKPTPTLRELLKDSYTLDYDDYPQWSLSLSDLDRAEDALLAPFKDEIARLREKVAAAETLRERVAYATGIASDGAWNVLTDALHAYDAAPVAASNLTGIPESSTPTAAPVGKNPCIECGGQGYWDVPGSASLRGTCWTCKGTGITPPAVADAGETETERCDERFKIMLEINEHVERNYEEQAGQLATLLRDVEALTSRFDGDSFHIGEIATELQNHEHRIDCIESRERPVTGDVEVTDKMMQAAGEELINRHGFQAMPSQVTMNDCRAMIQAALAAREAGQ